MSGVQVPLGSFFFCMKKFFKIFLLISVLLLIISCKGKEKSSVRLGTLKGPTSMGLSSLIDKSHNGETSLSYDVTLSALPEEISTLFLKGDLDVATVPVNLASVLYHKSEGKARLISINTENAIYVLSNASESINGVEDMVGKRIVAQGKGVMPNVILNAILNSVGMSESDLNITWKAEGSEVVRESLQDPNAILLLPEPYASLALDKNKSLKRAFSLTDEWRRKGLGDNVIIAVTIARSEFLKSASKSTIKALRDDISASIDEINNNPQASLKAIDELGIATYDIASKAIKGISFVNISGTEAKKELRAYYDVLQGISPKFIGGRAPNEDFYE